jgi:hypothetical protein
VSDALQRRTLVYEASSFERRVYELTGPLGPISLYWEVLAMWDRYLKVGVTLLLDVLGDPTEAKGNRKMILKVFKAIADAFSQDAEFRKAAQEAFK